MTYINITKCDGPGCIQETDNAQYVPKYHTLSIEGKPPKHFCSLKCLEFWVRRERNLQQK